MSDVTTYDAWLKDDGPAALVMREHLMPVEGRDGVLFPATFLGGYNIDGPPDGENVCLIDTVGSQANRVEPIFARAPYAQLLPQVIIRAGDREVNLLEAGHRAGDAIVRCSALKEELQNAFRAVQKGDAEPLAKIAPTSLVFGVWDSRDTQAKLPRLVGSTIRAFNVRKLTRSAVYIPPLDYSALEVFSEEDQAKAVGNNKSPLAQRGFVHNPASGSHGGVIATGGIRRDATLNLAALRLLRAGPDATRTHALQRYILGLALTAFTHPSAFVGYLRQGCTLVRDPEQAAEFVQVFPDGRRVPLSVTHEAALEYAAAAARAFGVGESRTVAFDAKRARADVQESADGKKKGKGKAKASAGPAEAPAE